MHFQFLRPAWLLALIPLALVLYLLYKRQASQRAWRSVIAPHLLPYLLEKSGNQEKVRPNLMFGTVMALCVFSAAGPSWKNEPSPFGEDEAALVIAVEASESMAAQDLQPTRIERATLKIKDLMDERGGAKTALVTYAGSAHLVLPPTKDTSLIASMAAELDPSIMPAKGDAPSKAVKIAERQLQSLPGSVLLITDGIPDAELEIMKQQRKEGAPPIHILGVGAPPGSPPPVDGPPAPPLDREALASAARNLGGSFVEMLPDSRDINALVRSIETNFAQAPGDNGSRPKDSGYALVPLIALLGIFWIRPGWNVNWNCLLAFFGIITLVGCGQDSKQAQSSGGSLFLTADQQAQKLFDEEDYREAAELFTEPMRKGTAYYRAGDFERAAATFGQATTPEAQFNRANSLLLQGKYDSAISIYKKLVEAQPDWSAPKQNLELAEARKEAIALSDDASANPNTGGGLKPDEIVFDDRPKNNPNAATDEVAGEGGQMDDKTMRAMWLKRVETKPAEFLKNKFAYQLQMEGADD